MIEIKGLVKDFDGFRALKGIDMTVGSGSIYGLVGTNGAGKTTILKLIAGVLNPDGGTVRIGGHPISDEVAAKDSMAFIPDDLSFFSAYNIKEAANLYAGLYSRWNGSLLEKIVTEFGLPYKVKISKFSKGMRKQAVFALSLATMPDYLLLDEPIDGLDPIMRKKIWEYIVGASADRGMTTLVSSHNLREMEGFCDTIGVIDHGEMKLERELDDLTSDTHKLQVSFGEPSKRPDGAYDALDVRQLSSTGSVDHLIVKGGREALVRWRDENRPLIFDMVPMSLEEVFVYELGGGSDVTYTIIGR
ncbi:MAG: ABC transporter ATP-binding protein [Clostridiales Family XIII bacterium]|jgi:ABC-2 type transport system ATP-binding protein|nr:ABC transporter ATP-binding protein [Clostridiales Family XIII bacterium]